MKIDLYIWIPRVEDLEFQFSVQTYQQQLQSLAVDRERNLLHFSVHPGPFVALGTSTNVSPR